MANETPEQAARRLAKFALAKGFVPVALGGLGNNRGAIIGGLALGVFQQAANFLVGGVFAGVVVFAVFIIVLLAAPQGLFGAPVARRV